MSLAVHHLAVVVRDLDKSEHFYSKILGLQVLRRHNDPEGNPRSVWVSLGPDAFLAIEKAAATEPLRSDIAPGFHCLALAIPKSERQAYRAHLTAGGYPVERESDYTLYTRDPDGNLVGLSHYPEAR